MNLRNFFATFFGLSLAACGAHKNTVLEAIKYNEVVEGIRLVKSKASAEVSPKVESLLDKKLREKFIKQLDFKKKTT